MKIIKLFIISLLCLPNVIALNRNPLVYLDFENTTYTPDNRTWAKSYTTTQYNGTLRQLINFTPGKVSAATALWFNVSRATTPFLYMGRFTQIDNRFNFSFSFWVRTAQATNEERLVEKSYNFYGLNIGTLGTNPRLYIRLSNTGSGWTSYLYSVSKFNDSNWHHIAYVKNDTHQNIWFDGVLENATAASGKFPAITDDLCIGAECQTILVKGAYFDGQIDDWAFFDYALNGSDVSELYASSYGQSPFCNGTFLNTSWSSFINISDCYSNNTVNNYNYVTQYDSTRCVMQNTTFYNYSSAACTYVNSCTYSGSGNWNIKCFDFCNITSTDMNRYNFTTYSISPGKVSGISNIYNYDTGFINSCDVYS